MKRLKLLLAGFLLTLPLFGWVAVAHAQSFRSGTNVTVPSGQIVDSTLYASGSSVDVAGDVNGDVFCAGQTVVVSGIVDGDVICAGQSVTISGTVRGSVRLAGQTVSVSGKVDDNASIAAQTFTLQSQGKVGGDVGVLAATAVFNGPVGRDLAANTADGSVTLNSTVGRNVQVRVDQLTLASGAQVGGNVRYTSANKIQLSSPAQVTGRITQIVPPASNPVWVGSLVAFAWVFAIYMFFALLLTALALVLIMPQAFQTATSYARQHMGKTFLVGLVSSIVVPIVLVVLFFTVIGIPLAIVLGLAWLLIVLLAGAFAAYLLGRMLLRNNTNAIVIMLVGAGVLLLVGMLPFVGPLVLLVAHWFGLGAIILRLVNTPRPHYVVVPVSEAVTEPEPVVEPVVIAKTAAVRKRSAKKPKNSSTKGV